MILCVVLFVFGFRVLLRIRVERRGGEWGFTECCLVETLLLKRSCKSGIIIQKFRLWKPALFHAIFNHFKPPSPARDAQDLASMQPFNKGRRAPQNVYVAAKDLRPGSIYIPDTETPDEPEPENPPEP